ncbi:MAG: polysaccharide pyruvyl transferase family protein [Clostridia bacterium]|nr:polysaccharide pyruvyl transferase family protein [Clostridia bacterium]
MKYGVLWRKTTKNIGDDVQSYAQSLFLPSVDYMVDIEDLEAFESDNHEPVATIMSAWYMWNKWKWPPSKDIYPIWVGVHYSDLQRGRPRGMPAKYEYVSSGEGLNYLKAYEPIGCRDYYTKEAFDKFGIKTFFSGCCTLTLPKRDIPKPEREYVCVVGVDPKVEKAIKKQLKGTGIDVVCLPPTRPEASTDMSWEERKAEVIRYLDTYQNAKCVITFRLHCSLPCLALETPVLLVRHGFNSPRFQPYHKWMHTAYPEQVINGEFKDFMLNPPANPDNYKETREKLIEILNRSIDEAKALDGKTADEVFKPTYSEVEFLRWKNKTMNDTLDTYLIEHRLDGSEIASLKKKVSKLEKENKVLRKQLDLGIENDDFPYNSRIIKAALKLRKFLMKFKKMFKK